VRPEGVDVASGVEGTAGPRRKDGVRLRNFFAAVRGEPLAGGPG
jgi:phosphoribosylanthranilate isomerase